MQPLVAWPRGGAPSKGGAWSREDFVTPASTSPRRKIRRIHFGRIPPDTQSAACGERMSADGSAHDVRPEAHPFEMQLRRARLSERNRCLRP